MICGRNILNVPDVPDVQDCQLDLRIDSTGAGVVAYFPS